MHIHAEATRAFRTAAGLALVIALGACGGGSEPPSQPVIPPTTTLPPASVVSQGSDTLEAGFVGQVSPFTTTRTGTIEVTVDWTFATNDVDIALTRGVCTPQQFLDLQCNIATFSDSVTAKPERIRLASSAAGTYTIILANAGPEHESLSWQAVLTPTIASSSVDAGSEKGLALPDKLRNYRGGVSW
jgi:hypothetical protein